MIVGIDDSGSFKDEDMGLFAAVYIRPKKYEKLKKIFESWENDLPDKCKKDGEVKGWLLSDEQLAHFAENILLNNNVHGTKHHVFATPLVDFNIETIEYQRKRNVGQLLEGAEQYRKDGKKYYEIAQFYEDMSKWLSKRSLKTLLKIELLASTIFGSINDSIIWSVNKGFDRELGQLTIRMDKGFIEKPIHMNYWLDTMRTALWHLSYHGGGFIHLDTWTSNHPYVKRFNKFPKSRENLAVFTNEIRNCMNFYDSKEYLEIRMADIIASSYFRHYVKKEKLDSMDIFKKTRLYPSKTYTIVAVQPTKVETPNPYLDEIGGTSLKDLESKAEQ